MELNGKPNRFRMAEINSHFDLTALILSSLFCFSTLFKLFLTALSGLFREDPLAAVELFSFVSDLGAGLGVSARRVKLCLEDVPSFTVLPGDFSRL